MKKIDKLLITSFIPPLIIWFLVAVFIFNMQFLWKYIDDIVGKGLEIHVILELLFYQALAMVPRGLVFGVMIASVMTLGNLAENYELASMKSSGISLIRILRPLILVCTFLGFASFLFSNYLIPVSALQFKTRLYDIRRQKPALDLEEGQFNHDFKTLVIYIGSKDKSSSEIRKVRIYDHSKYNGNSNQTNAEKGKLTISPDKRFLTIQLQKGIRFENIQLNTKNAANYFPYMRTQFSEYSTVMDLSEFNFSETDKELFKNHHSLMSFMQLKQSIDTIKMKAAFRNKDFNQSLVSFFYFRKKTNADKTPIFAPDFEMNQSAQYAKFSDAFPTEERRIIFQRAQSHVRNIKMQAENFIKSRPRIEEEIAAHENEMHLKLVFSFACLLFLFIGAPMGAIIKKGGFGWPIFISFVFFMIFFVLHLTGERLATGNVWTTWVGSWLPIWALLPIAFVITYKALADRPLFSFRFPQLQFKRK